MFHGECKIFHDDVGIAFKFYNFVQMAFTINVENFAIL